MKMLSLLLSFACLQLAAKGYSQEITISLKDAPLEKAFKEIEKQTPYHFFYSSEAIKLSHRVTIEVKNESLENVLKLCFNNQPISYSIEDKLIIVNIIEEKKNTDNLFHDVRGKVVNENGEPLAGITIRVKESGRMAITDVNGEFVMTGISPNDVLIISGAEIEVVEINVKGKTDLEISVKTKVTALHTVSVNVNTGYQQLPKERLPGSFVFVDSQLINRRVSTDILSRLEGIVPGLIFNHNTLNASLGKADISIRGHSTIFANDQPLIIVDNFPYEGNINNINPNDIESITVLKDAAASSIWGVRSGNGVIVITTKEGKLNQKLTVELNSNMTIGEKPDLFYNPNFLPANDFINVEDTLFKKGYYNADLNDPSKIISPVVQILAKQRSGIISPADAATQINALRNVDVRQEIQKYFYRTAVSQQSNINFKGGSNNMKYFFSMGYDKNRSNLVGNKNERITLNAITNFYPLKNLEFELRLNFNQTSAKNNSTINDINPSRSKRLFPYAQLTDGNGKALAITKDYSSTYTDTAGGGKFLNWKYFPLDEFKFADNSAKLIDNRINLGLRYTFFRALSSEIKYQYETETTTSESYYSLSSYYARNLINQFTQVNSDGTLSYPIPIGGILNQGSSTLTAHKLRAQLNFLKKWNQKHDVAAIAGAEINQTIIKTNTSGIYGYNKNTGAFSNVDYINYFSTNPPGSSQIPNNFQFAKLTDRYVSYYSNAAYTYCNRYTFSASGRIDKSNLFGVNTNQKSIPLYSAGLSWDFSKENFYPIKWLPFAKIRITYGYNGNVDKAVAAITTIQDAGYPAPYYGLSFSRIANPGNSELRWEKIKMFNVGLDFGLRDQRITGSFEYYHKKGIDLFGDSPLPPSTGLLTFRGNTAQTSGNGIDMTLNSKNVSGKNFSWLTNFLFSYATDKVTNYDVKSNVSSYIIFGPGNAGTYLPLKGKPLFAIYSYRWAGLNPATGDPQGYLNKIPSTNYSSIIASSPVDSLVYNGPSRPTIFGSLRNSFYYKGISLSFNIIYKLHYYFRKSSISYTGLFANWFGHEDFLKRWQKPGDELYSNVPSIQYPPVNGNRELFYQSSEILVDKADHVRLQDVSISYDLNKNRQLRLPVHLIVYGYINNIAILWRANHDHLDPDIYATSLPDPRTYSLGIKANF
jgi:TonB-linked SusC/RagA family outer membrane protein